MNTQNASGDVDADASYFDGIEHTGGFTYSLTLGKSSGNVFFDTDLGIFNSSSINVLSGTPTFSGMNEGLGAPGYNSLLLSGSLYAQQMIQVNSSGATTYSALGTCSSTLEGQMAAIKDANYNTWGHTITSGGGSDHVLVYCDGTSWTVAAQ